MLRAPGYHFAIDRQSDLLADIDVWEPAEVGVFEKGHIHSYYEMLIFKRGGGTHQMADEIYEVADYSIHILANNNYHELKRTTATDGFEIIFSQVFLNQLQQFDKNTNYIRYFAQSRVLNFKEDEFREFQIYFDELIRHKNNKSFFYNLVSLIILKIISSDIEAGGSTTHITFEKSLIALVNKHYKEKQSRHFYASKFHMGLNTFQRRTKAAFGKSVIELQNERILQEAKFLISQNEKTIKEISADFHFSDEAHFNHFFKNHIGMTPAAYRKAALN